MMYILSEILINLRFRMRGLSIPFYRVTWKVAFATLTLALMTFISCKPTGDKNKLPSSIVENPATAAGSVKADDMPVMYFDKLEHDFGRVIQGEVITYAFRLENTGRKPLVIASVSSSCGCTVADYPAGALEPGSEGFIKVTFDSNNRRGFQSKTVTVLANTQPNSVTLRVKAQVVSSAD